MENLSEESRRDANLEEAARSEMENGFGEKMRESERE